MNNPNQQAQFILRCFIKPDGRQVVDFVLSPGFIINDIMPLFRADGAFWGAGQSCVPWDAVLWMTLIPYVGPPVAVDMNPKPKFSVVPLHSEDKPT